MPRQQRLHQFFDLRDRRHRLGRTSVTMKLLVVSGAAVRYSRKRKQKRAQKI
jgi:hypothetical protein